MAVLVAEEEGVECFHCCFHLDDSAAIKRGRINNEKAKQNQISIVYSLSIYS